MSQITDVSINEPEDLIHTTDEAFMSAMTPKELNGIKLEAFSLMRQVIAMEITTVESSPFFNAVVRTWICTLTPDEVMEARRDKTQAVVDAFAWAEAQGFSFNNYQPLIDLYNTINREIEKSSSAVDREQQEPAKNSGGPQE
jgi:hypothetical protein